MRKFSLLVLFVLASVPSFAQNLIKNDAKPLANDAGRVLSLTEVWRITDDRGQFFFKYPHNLKIAEDGSIFLADVGQFLKFSADGRFLGNLYKKGQGPGEIGREFSYQLRGRDLFVRDMNSQRFWRADLEGRFQGSISLAGKDYRGFVGAIPDGFLFLKTVWPPPSERTGKLMELLQTVALVGPDGAERRDVAVFRPKVFLGPDAMMAWDPDILELSPDRALLYAVHSRDYVVEVVDIATGGLVRRINRSHPKVAHAEADWEPDFRKRTGAPKMEFDPDVAELFSVKGGLWVATSTDGKAKGRLVDVFDGDGRFVDSFYLGAGKTLMAVREDTIFCQQKNEDETITIAKYRIVR